jgi:hypothetical protein
MDDAAALDAAVHMLDAHTPAGNAPIGGFLRACEGSPPRLLRRHDHFDLWEHKRQKAEILEQAAPRWQGIRGPIGDPLVVGAARIGRTEKENRECRVDQQHVFDRVVLFLAAIIARLLSRILGALDAPFGPVVPKRGEAGAGSSVGATMAAASASAIPRRLANSVKERVGVSPSVRSVARRTTKRT